MYDGLVKRLRDAAKMSEALAVLLPHSEGNATAKLYNEAADAIEGLEQYAELYKGGGEAAKKAAETYKAAYIAEHDARVAELPRWIPVTERLPGTGEIVLVYGKRGGIYTAEHNRNARWPGTFWKLNSKSHHCEPTHWMPLPQPPEEGET